MTGVSIRLFEKPDWNAVANIYRLGIDTKHATFETTVPDLATWLGKFHPNLLWVAEVSGQVVGWAGLQPVSVRQAYAGVAELTIYVHPQQAGKGIGKALMNHLVDESERAGIWTLFASVFAENKTSIHLHARSGFREIGYREKIAQVDGKWRNTILFERRSKKVGV